MVDFLILYFKYSHLGCLSVILSQKFDFSFFQPMQHLNLKNFQNSKSFSPELAYLLFVNKKISVSDQCKRKQERQLEIGKKSNRSMKPETWFCRNVKRPTLGLLILQIRRK